MQTFHQTSFAHSQRGVVLIVALVMLLLLTLIGVAGLRDTQLQERMAGGAQDRELALQAAEAGLRFAEKEVQDGNVNDIDSGNAVKDYNSAGDDPADLRRSNGGVEITEVEYWRDVYNWTGTNSNVYNGTPLIGVTSNPRFVIEQLPNSYSGVPGSANATGTAYVSGSTAVKDYLITVRASGASNDTVVILQSLYRYTYVVP